MKLITRKGNKLQLTGSTSAETNLLTGDTYPIKDYIKTYMDGKWDKANSGWIVNTEKVTDLVFGENSIGLCVDNNNVPSLPVVNAKAISDGWCKKCQSWCYGDCEAN